MNLSGTITVREVSNKAAATPLSPFSGGKNPDADPRTARVKYDNLIKQGVEGRHPGTDIDRYISIFLRVVK